MLAGGNLGFLLGAAALYVLARQKLLVSRAGERRRVELAACFLVSGLVVAGFALAHLGVNETWTGRVAFADVRWLEFALLTVGALFAAHLLLRLLRSRADELVLPVAAFLAALGLVNLYVWELRDADAYVSTVALPALRGLGDDPATAAERRELRRWLGPVPNELSATSPNVLDPAWRNAYDGVAERYAALRAARPGLAREVPVRRLDLYRPLKRQLAAVWVALLLAALLAVALARAGVEAVAGRTAAVVAPAALVVLVGASLATSRNRELPALLDLGGRTFTVFEIVKLALVVALAATLAAPARARRRTLGLTAVVVAVSAMLWRDLGAGLALLAVAVLMVALVARTRVRYALAAAAVFAVVAAPAVARTLGEHVPETARVRLEMWTDPWGTYDRAQVQNRAAHTVERLTASERGALRDQDVRRIERELRWRLDALESVRGSARPFVPGADPFDARLLAEVEQLWAALGGFRAVGGSVEARGAVADRVDRAMETLRREARANRDEASVAPDDFQLQRAAFALRQGGLAGVGLGRGRPEAVPGLVEDVPLAAVGEALGFAGLAVVALFLLLLVGRGLEVGLRNGRRLALLAAGLAFVLGLQTLVAIGGMVGLLPFTGLTFPFLSRSGSGIVASCAILAVLAAAAQTAPRPRREQPGGARRLLAVGGFPAAFGVVLLCVATLQLTGRTLTFGPVLGTLPGRDAAVLHASNQWDATTYRVIPGAILDRHGRPLARTRFLGGARTYPDRGVATSLGHTLFQLDLAFGRRLRDAEPGSATGPALVTTIDADVQRALAGALDAGGLDAGLPDVSSLRGAAVLVDVADGSLVALASRPTFALAELSDPEQWAAAERRERRAGFPYRYLNRSVNGFYPPGSVFKTVTAAGTLERGLHTLYSRDFDYRHGSTGRRAPDGIDQLGFWHQLPLEDGPPITDGNHSHLDDWTMNLAEAYTWSCNVAFAELGIELGAAGLVEFARRFGFERPLTVRGLGTETSTLDNHHREPLRARYLAGGASALARTAFGQGQARVTPLQMALVPAAIANGGKIMQPHVVAGWRSPSGRWLERARPSVFADTRLSAITIEELQQMMRESVTYGWAGTARVNPNNANPGVAGKTGSAEWSEELDAAHAWFIGFFPVEAPRLAFAVVIERGGSGPTVAARIARRVFSADAVQEYVRGAPTS